MLRKIFLFILFTCSLFATQNLQKVSLELKWKYQFQFAGFIAAKEKGFYKDAGLDVDILEYKPDRNIINDVLNQKIDFGLGDSALILKSMQGFKVKALMAIYQHSPFVLIGLKSSNIDSLIEANNKKIALFDDSNGITIKAMLASFGIKYKKESVRDKLDRLLNHDIDLMTAYSTNEPFVLREKGISIDVYNPRDFGFDAYGDMLFTSQKLIDKNPELVKNMYDATKKGFIYAFSHIDEMVNLIYKKYNTQHKSIKALTYEANILKKLAQVDKNFGEIKQEKIKSIAQLYSFLIHDKYDLNNLNNFIYSQNDYNLNLTSQEKKWIKEHPFVFYSEVSWAPLSIIKDGKMTGILGGFLELITKYTGLKFRYIPSKSWNEVIQKFKDKKLDILPSNPQEKHLGLVSDVYKEYPMVIVTGKKYRFIENLNELDGKTIAVPKYYTSYNYLTSKYPKIKLIITKDIPNALLKVQSGKADAFVGHIATSLHYLELMHLTDLKISGTAGYKFKHSFLVQNRYPLLLSIINKAFRQITPKDKEALFAKWVHIKTMKEIDYTILWEILSIVFLIIFLILYKNTKLKKANIELKANKKLLFHQANHDVLTNLPNRALFYDRLEQDILKGKRHQEKFALLFLDLDKFKQVNDSLGHDIGDELLKMVAKKLKNSIREVDTLARLGGDEFTIIIDGVHDLKEISLVSEKIIDLFKQPMEINGNLLYITISIGISIYPNDGEDTTALIKNADIAMYRAKEEGRNNFQFYSPMMTKILSQQIELEINLKKAIQNREFLVYYQPQYDGKSDKLIGMEALVRWKHPTMGLVPPAQFILVAKKTEMIVDIDRFVTDEAMAQFKIWQKAGLNPGILSANFSIRSLDSDDFIDTIASYLKKYDFDPKLLKLEISETHAMNKTEEMLGKLSELSALGVSIAIDDFGTGYSSLSYLKKLPVDTLKIDQAFVRGLVADEDDVSIVKAIISLAKNLNLELIAEGVETEEQRDFLVENECINIQGYYYAKPMPTDEIQKILENC